MPTLVHYLKALVILVLVLVVGYSGYWSYERLKLAELTYRYLTTTPQGATKTRAQKLDELTAPPRSPAPDPTKGP